MFSVLCDPGSFLGTKNTKGMKETKATQSESENAPFRIKVHRKSETLLKSARRGLQVGDRKQ